MFKRKNADFKKANTKWNLNLNVKTKARNLPEENIRENFV